MNPEHAAKYREHNYSNMQRMVEHNRRLNLVPALERNKAALASYLEAQKNFVPVTFTPEDIVTTDQTERMTFCKATLVSHGFNGMVSFSFTTGGATTNPTLHVPVTYTVERTDDGRLYVTVYGLSQFSQF